MKFGKKAWVIAGALALGTALVWTLPAKAADNDHYAGYQIKSKIKDKPTGTIADMVETGNFTKCKAKLLLVPAAKNGGPAPANPVLQYLCWQCKGGKPVVAYTVTDQFVGNAAISTKKLKLICNIATVS